MNTLNKSLNIKIPDTFTIGTGDSKLFLINLEDDKQCFEVSGICSEILQTIKMNEQDKVAISTIQNQVWESVSTYDNTKLKNATEAQKLTREKFDKAFDEFINYLICHQLVIID